jgi:exonuclease SbcC
MQLRSNQARWQEDLARDQERLQELEGALGGAAEVERELRQALEQLEAMRGQESRARLALGAAQQKLAHCQHLRAERETQGKRLKQLAEEKSLYRDLQVSFGQKGLRAMIIESAIPEIEEEANHLLARMTENRMQVRFDTQRETLKGETVETLDIKIADELGTRDYEMYSGGEAFRVNFAVRIALSKLLARRAGAQLQTLIVDEGFGTQDTQGRERLIEAINSIRDDFACILVITHIEELQDAFPVRINVLKTAEGSRFEIV